MTMTRAQTPRTIKPGLRGQKKGGQRTQQTGKGITPKKAAPSRPPYLGA